MDFSRFDSSNIRFCINCAKPFYSDFSKMFFSDNCFLCETIFESQKAKNWANNSNCTQYQILVDKITQAIKKHKINSLLDTESYPIENNIGTDNLILPSKTEWEYTPIKKVNNQISIFDRLEYYKLQRIYSEHNLYEHLALARLVNLCNSSEELRANMSKYYFSLFRYSSLNPPNIVEIETDYKSYNSPIISNKYEVSHTRKEHIEKHLTIPEGLVFENKSSCKPWIKSSNFIKAIHEIKRFILAFNSPSDCICFRTINSMFQMRVYYRLDPILVIIINDLPLTINKLKNSDKPFLVTCFTSKSIFNVLAEIRFNNQYPINLMPDFLAGIKY